MGWGGDLAEAAGILLSGFFSSVEAIATGRIARSQSRHPRRAFGIGGRGGVKQAGI